MSNRVFCLMGPTASGKTALACELVARYPMEIISVDSAMIYRDMNIGTAKPSDDEQKLAPHHLIDIRDPIETYSAAQFCADASVLCDSILNKGKIPLLVGGTMMYFNALQKGLSTLPDANELIRQQIEAEAEQSGWGVLHQQLATIDPEAAARIHAHDAQRIQRALEVFYITGTPLSALLAEQQKVPGYEFVNVALFPEQRAWLHERIAQRFDQMLTQGFIDEVVQLQEKWQVNRDLPSMRSVGYRQALEYLNGEYDAATLREKGIAATRQLAKRQLTWLRSWENIQRYDPRSATYSDEIMAAVNTIL